MRCLYFITGLIFIFFSLLKSVSGYVYPMCSRNEIGCEENIKREADNNLGYFLTTLTATLNCLFCSTLSFIKAIYYDFLPRANLILANGKSYKYKPPPSLFENLAIWSGVIREDHKDDEIWEAEKIFMLASAIIFSMFFLYYGQNWLTIYTEPKLYNYGICRYCKKYLPTATLSASTFATCTCSEDHLEVSS